MASRSSEPVNDAIALLKEINVRTPPRVTSDDMAQVSQCLVVQLEILAKTGDTRAEEAMKAMLTSYGPSGTDDLDPARAAYEAVRGDVEVVRSIAEELRRRLHEQAAIEEAERQREFASQQLELARSQIQRADLQLEQARTQAEQSKAQAKASSNIAIASIAVAAIFGAGQTLVPLLKRDTPPVVNLQLAVSSVPVSVTPPPLPTAPMPLTSSFPSAEPSALPLVPPDPSLQATSSSEPKPSPPITSAPPPSGTGQRTPKQQ